MRTKRRRSNHSPREPQPERKSSPFLSRKQAKLRAPVCKRRGTGAHFGFSRRQAPVPLARVGLALAWLYELFKVRTRKGAKLSQKRQMIFCVGARAPTPRFCRGGA